MKLTAWEKEELLHYLRGRLIELPPLVELDPAGADLWRDEIRQFEALIQKIQTVEIERGQL